MKKLFTLVTLLLCAVVGTQAAGEEFFIKFQNSKNITESTSGYFTYNKGEGTAVSWSSKGKHKCTYDDETYSDVIKMESATQAYFTSLAEATVTIVQTTSNATGDKLKFDGVQLNSSMANTSVIVDTENTCNIYTITNVAAGKHIITRETETGLAYIKVVYTGSEMTKLSTPTITINSSNGEVTIGAVANASKVTYTLDGSNPDADSDEYTAPFVAADGVTVKAIAIGDGVSYTNSDVASEVVIRDDAVIEAPVIKQLNGTVAITCATVGATIEYSTNGVDYVDYSRAFTLTADATVYARAKRGGKISDVANAAVTTIGRGAATKTIWMGHGSFDNNDKNSMTGKAGDAAEGFVLTITGNSEKKWSSGGAKINIGGIERTAIKLSNGAQNTLTIPTGYHATRITFYSFINSAEARTSYWSEVNGETYTADVPMGAWNTVDDRLTNPDARVFALDGESSITFTNAGEQLCFIIAIDVIEAPQEVTMGANGWATAIATKNLDFSGVAGLTAYTATESAGVVTLTKVNDVPAGTGVVLKGDNSTKYEVPAIYESTTDAGALQGSATATTTVEGDFDFYGLTWNGSKAQFAKINAGQVIPAGKAFLKIAAASARETLDIVFAGNETTGIENVKAAAEDGAVYNLQGVRVAQPTKGLYIMNGKKMLVK